MKLKDMCWWLLLLIVFKFFFVLVIEVLLLEFWKIDLFVYVLLDFFMCMLLLRLCFNRGIEE